MRRDVAARIETHARWAANGRLTVGVRKPNAARRQFVDVRSTYRRVAGAAQVIEPELVTHDEKDVLSRHVGSLPKIEAAHLARLTGVRADIYLCDPTEHAGRILPDEAFSRLALVRLHRS